LRPQTQSWTLRPAEDFDLAPREKLVSLKREPGAPGAILHAVWTLLLRFYLRLAHRFSVVGRSNLPDDLPYVIVANHSSHYDTLALTAALPIRQGDRIFALAAGDTFFKSFLSSLLASGVLNALPIWRTRTRREHLSLLRERLLRRDCGYILFPEGTRSRDGQMRTFKSGVGALVAGSDTPVVPCHIDGAFEAFPPDAKRPCFARVTIRFGAPISFTTIENSSAGWRTVAEACERAVRQLGD
jgi:1-acyl-sn-glycerol-3-phosphate acyltransferase